MKRHKGNSMAITPVSIRIPEQTRDHLDQLSNRTRRSRSFLMAEALDEYLDRNEW